jgi:trimethylamine--corrinoid protein Co-methyltransferase
MNTACAEMMTHYQIPHAGTSGSGEGWGGDMMAAGNIWMNHLTALLGKAGLAPFVGSSLNSKAYSPLQTVYANDVIGQARVFAEGFSVDDESVGVDELIEAMAIDGHFLTSMSTMKRYKNAYWQGLYPHISLEKWEEMGCPSTQDVLRERTKELIDNSKAPDDHDELITRGEAFIKGL